MTSDPEIMRGTRVFKGTRIPVDLVADMPAQSPTAEEILEVLGFAAAKRSCAFKQACERRHGVSVQRDGSMASGGLAAANRPDSKGARSPLRVVQCLCTRLLEEILSSKDLVTGSPCGQVLSYAVKKVVALSQLRTICGGLNQFV